jgi:hypothetical protein
VAFHSRYIAEVAPKLRLCLERVGFMSLIHTVES